MTEPPIDPDAAASLLDAFLDATAADLGWMITLLDEFARAHAVTGVQE